jgi:hypothetical protein
MTDTTTAFDSTLATIPFSKFSILADIDKFERK